ncbi:hypothetical protein BDV93DRAFT_510962 [Ceratobasidium sp. AG-I]|nr:hypothetical protein BDV93DRAFT_510962 [Ceratobasidium sp. AG-I]
MYRALDCQCPNHLMEIVNLTANIDGNFRLCNMQSKVAKEISHSSGADTVLQLNMGKGKSPVIVPIIAATLADSSRVVRVVILNRCGDKLQTPIHELQQPFYALRWPNPLPYKLSIHWQHLIPHLPKPVPEEDFHKGDLLVGDEVFVAEMLKQQLIYTLD